MAFCKSCGNEINGVKFCSKCGTPVEENVNTVSSVAPVQPIYNNQPVNNLPKDNWGVAAFICGLVGVTACCGITSIPGLICSIISINKVKKGEVDSSNKWMGVTGLVLSIIGIIAIILIVIWYIFVIYMAMNDPSYYA